MAMKPVVAGLMVAVAAAWLLPAHVAAHPILGTCPPDSVNSGTACLDAYEASVWRVPDATGMNQALVTKIRDGTVKPKDLTDAGATPLGRGGDDYAPCTDDGSGCTDVFAVSLSNRRPSRFLTWFQAQQACKNSSKRLPSNAEWQAAVAGTPNPGADDGADDCNTTTATGSLPEDPVLTGSRSGCVSSDGAFDMVGNLSEWVADWVPASTACPGWFVTFSDDLMCLSGASTTELSPGALLRGGNFFSGPEAGPFSVAGGFVTILADNFVGFRCAR
jgi:formylglycine-generating enzyme required for sulfatase activity